MVTAFRARAMAAFLNVKIINYCLILGYVLFTLTCLADGKMTSRTGKKPGIFIKSEPVSFRILYAV